MDAHLLQGGVDAEGAQAGILLHEPDGVHDGEGDLAASPRPPAGPVLQSVDPLLGPPPQGPVDGGLARLEVPRHGLRRPPVDVQLHDGATAFFARGHLVVGRVAPHRHQGRRALLQHPLNGVLGGPPAEGDVADPRQLPQAEGGVLGLAVDDEPPHGGREAAEPGRFGGEQALHALGLEAAHPAVERALGDARLSRTLGHGAPEQGQRPDLLVGQLLGPPAKQRELLPVVGRLHASFAPSRAHLVPPPPRCRVVGRVACHRREPPASRKLPEDGRLVRRLATADDQVPLPKRRRLRHGWCTHSQRTFRVGLYPWLTEFLGSKLR